MRYYSNTYKGESEDIEYPKEQLLPIHNSPLLNKILSVKACVAIVCIFFQTGPLCAGGWPQGKGGYFIKLSEWWIVSDQHFGARGERQVNTHEFGYFATSLYAEYGITSRLTGILNYPFINFVYAIPGSMSRISYSVSGDADIGLKYGVLHNKPIALSLTAFAGIPLGKERGELAGGLQTGDGEFNQGILLDAASGFKVFNTTGWVNLHGGFNNRTNNYSDEILYGLESGINLSANKIIIILRMNGVSSNEQGSAPLNPQSLFSNNKEYLSLSPELAYNFDDHWSLTVGMGTALSGKNIFANTTYTIGIINQKKKYEEKK